VSKATPSKKAKATPKEVKAAADEGESPTLPSSGKKATKAKPKVKTEDVNGGDEEVVESVEGSKGIALGEEFFLGS